MELSLAIEGSRVATPHGLVLARLGAGTEPDWESGAEPGWVSWAEMNWRLGSELDWRLESEPSWVSAREPQAESYKNEQLVPDWLALQSVEALIQNKGPGLRLLGVVEFEMSRP